MVSLTQDVGTLLGTEKASLRPVIGLHLLDTGLAGRLNRPVTGLPGRLLQPVIGLVGRLPRLVAGLDGRPCFVNTGNTELVADVDGAWAIVSGAAAFPFF